MGWTSGKKIDGEWYRDVHENMSCVPTRQGGEACGDRNSPASQCIKEARRGFLFDELCDRISIDKRIHPGNGSGGPLF